MSDKTELAWHFVGGALRDGRSIPPDGGWLKHEGQIELCASGFHASTRIIDALRYAPGSTVCRVAVCGRIKRDTDKLVGAERVILWRFPAADATLRAFARKAALSVIHLWDAPDVVRRYLETGDKSIRAAAWDAAKDAAWDDARAAAWDAAWDAARDAAWDAAWAAATQKFNDELEAMIREAAGSPNDNALLVAAKKRRS